MSAAEQATPPTPMNTGEGAAVIDLNRQRPKRRGTALTAAQGRWSTVNTPAGHPPTPHEPGSRSDQISVLADTAERFFNEIRRTLTNEETARIYTRTIGFVGHLLDGAVAQDILTQAQRDELAVLMVGAMEAPQHV